MCIAPNLALMSKARRAQQHHAPLQLIAVNKPLAPLPDNNGWNAETGSFDWPAVERNFNFTSMGRVVAGDSRFYFQPLPAAQLGHQPHPLAVALHDVLWDLHRFLQRTRGRRLSEAETRTIAESKAKILAAQRQVWAATFEPTPAPAPQVQQLTFL
jgi:hypothetical protein